MQKVAERIVSYLLTVIESWILGTSDDLIGGILSLTFDDNSFIKYFIRIKRETRKTGETVIGTLIINISYKIGFKKNGGEVLKEGKFERIIINLQAYIRSMRILEYISLIRILGMKPITTEHDLMIPIQFIDDLEKRLVYVQRVVKDDLSKTLSEVFSGKSINEVRIKEVDLKVTTKKTTSDAVDIFFRLIKYLLQQYIDISQLRHVERELHRKYGTDETFINSVFSAKWREGLARTINLLARYFEILEMSKRLSPVVFVSALAKNLGAQAAKKMFQRFWHLLDGFSTDERVNKMKENIRSLLQQTTLFGAILEDYEKIESLENPCYEKFEKMITHGLKSVLDNIKELKEALNKNISSREEFLVLIREIFRKKDISEDDKVALIILLTAMFDYSLITRILKNLRSDIVCNRCLGYRIVNALLLTSSKASSKLLDELDDIIYLLIYSKELKEDTYRIILAIAYLLKSILLKKIGDISRAEKTWETTMKLADMLHVPRDILLKISRAV